MNTPPFNSEEFMEKFPAAYNWLLDKSLRAELESLRRELDAGGFFVAGRINWMKNRIKELEWLFEGKETK